MVHDSIRSRQNQLSELAGRKQIRSQLLNLIKSDVESRRDDTALVEATQQIDHNFTASMVINNLEGSDVTVLLHDLEKLDDDF